MKNIFKIYKNDLKDIFTNKVLLVIIIGLCILPSLYAWFNIKASWDPYGNTGNISVAVINEDSGAEIMNKNTLKKPCYKIALPKISKNPGIVGSFLCNIPS